MKKKTIAIIGVDGTGKSTVIDNVSLRLGDNCIVKYMGSRSYEDVELEQLLTKKRMSKIELLRSIWLQYRCFWTRYNDAVRSGKIALFDRYIHEIYLNSNGVFKVIYTILYKYLYPRPSSIIYLHCSANESLRRKDDIPNPDVFRAMKSRFDNYFLGNKSCFCLNSEEHSPQELADLVYNYIVWHYGIK